jgi:hypothetical protein
MQEDVEEDGDSEDLDNPVNDGNMGPRNEPVNIAPYPLVRQEFNVPVNLGINQPRLDQQVFNVPVNPVINQPRLDQQVFNVPVNVRIN